MHFFNNSLRNYKFGLKYNNYLNVFTMNLLRVYTPRICFFKEIIRNFPWYLILFIYWDFFERKMKKIKNMLQIIGRNG